MKEIPWSGIVNGRKCRIWHDGRTDQMNDKGLWERTGDANVIVASCVCQLVDRLNNAETTIEKLRLRRLL